MKSPFISASIVALAFCGSVFAQTTKPLNAAQQAIKDLTDKIASTDPAVRAAAVEELRQQIKHPANIVGPLGQQYLPALLKAGLNQEAADFAMQAILSGPSEPGTLEILHKHRIRALLALNKPDEALAEAKSLFNVCRMKTTGDALRLCAQCLQAAHPDDKSLSERFKLQQVAGSTCSPQAGATQPSTQPTSAQPNLLKAIKINPEPYLAAAEAPVLLQNQTEDAHLNFARLTSRGNLLLEADKIAEAKQCFEAAYPQAGPADQPQAAESLARVMKAEDGTVGRANAYVMSLRPATQPAQK